MSCDRGEAPPKGQLRGVACGRARFFWSGRSQAIRLPKESRIEEVDLLISRRGKALVLEPRREPVDAKSWPRTFWKLFGALPDDFDLGLRDQPAERSSSLDDE